MALTLLAANNAQTVLAAGINATATTLTVNTGTGNLFPSPVSGTSFFKLTLVDSATGSLSEIVHVTSRTGDTMTIERAQEGTTARIWSANDIAANMLTAGSLQLYAQKDQSLLIANNLSEIANAGPDAVAQTLSNLRLERFQQADDATRIFSPDGNVYLRIDNTGWYFARKNSGKIPASIDAGGTGATTAKDAVYNLGLGAGAPAIGIPFFWPLAAMPNTVMDEWSDMVFLKPNGASFSAATYPKLAKVWTGLVIPDMRGEFPRIWDDGRGVDSGRALLSYQGDASRNITGSFGGTTNNDTCSVLGNGAGVFANSTSLTTPTNGSVIGSATRPVTMTLDISRQVPTAAEFRSRNIALNFLVRAK